MRGYQQHLQSRTAHDNLVYRRVAHQRAGSGGRCASIFSAEIYAIDRCDHFNTERNYKNRNIAFLPDSQVAIKALKSNQVSPKVVWECLGKLNTVGLERRSGFLWVPVRVGIQCNEVADELGKKGAETPFNGPEPFCGVGKNSISTMIMKKERKLRETYWENLPEMKQFKALRGQYKTTKGPTTPNWDIDRITILVLIFCFK